MHPTESRSYTPLPKLAGRRVVKPPIPVVGVVLGRAWVPGTRYTIEWPDGSRSIELADELVLL